MKQEMRSLLDRARFGYGLKLVAIAVLLAAFIAPLTMVRQIINDRSYRGEAARNEIVESWGGRIGVSGPYLLVPLSRNEVYRDAAGNSTQRKVTQDVILFPETLSVEMDAATETRSRGIYSVPVVAAEAMNGGAAMSVMPVGRQTDVAIRSDWPSPSFYGSSLPAERDYSEEGFSARWSVNYLSRSLPTVVVLRAGQSGGAYTDPLGVFLFRPDDPYKRNERGFKYAWLFLIVPFLTFFLFEVIRKRRIHVVQYLLAGSTDVVFYLLLLSLSEQMTFMAAYLVTAVAITVLLSAYGTTVLRGFREGLLLGTILGIGYGYLAVVLQSEDYALLLGSVGLFVVLATVMYLTRNITWYGTEEKREG
jgi:inner membrane protein involved in colicin E2 resistance